MTCTNTFDICVIRGTNFSLPAGLSATYVEVIEAPAEWEAVMTFVDTGVEVRVEPEINTDDPTMPPVQFIFALDPQETSALPEWDQRYTVDLVRKPEAGELLPRSVERLFGGKVEVHA
jgi:hypothetical protein